MGWFGKLAFGSMGLFLGGPIGAVIGAALGHLLVDKQGDLQPFQGQIMQSEQAQAVYFVSIFSILGKLSKIDGVVSREEITVVNKFINSLNINENEKLFAMQIFKEAKESPYSIRDFAFQFYQINMNSPEVLNSFLDILFQVAAADGALHHAEEDALEQIKEIFQISDAQFNNLKGIYFDGADKYYKCLNCTPESPVQEIKASYKKLVKDFHPDTIVSKGLPEEFMDFATKRFHEIQTAYEQIRKERNF
jgi:DnaJ like chaperone protein